MILDSDPLVDYLFKDITLTYVEYTIVTYKVLIWICNDC